MSKPPGQVPAQPRANAWIALVVGCHGVLVLQSDGTEQLCMTNGRRPGWDVEYPLHAVDTGVTSSHSGPAVSSPNVLYQSKLKQRQNKKIISLPDGHVSISSVDLQYVHLVIDSNHLHSTSSILYSIQLSLNYIWVNIYNSPTWGEGIFEKFEASLFGWFQSSNPSDTDGSSITCTATGPTRSIRGNCGPLRSIRGGGAARGRCRGTAGAS